MYDDKNIYFRMGKDKRTKKKFIIKWYKKKLHHGVYFNENLRYNFIFSITIQRFLELDCPTPCHDDLDTNNQLGLLGARISSVV
jgi:hypothetical protein